MDRNFTVSLLWRYFASTLAGLSLPFAFAPLSISALAVVAMTVLFLNWINATPKQAFIHGYLFGVAMFSVGVSWVFVSMSDFGGVPLLAAVFLTTLFILFLALFPATAGVLALRYFRGSSQWILAATFPVLWTLFEWVRGWIFTGFPWLLLGYSQIDAPLSGWAPLVGAYGLSYVTALLAGLLALGFTQGASALRWGIPFIILALPGSYLLRGIEWGQPLGAPLKVALLQGNVSQDIKWRPEQRQPTIDLYVELTRKHWGADLIIWPETAFPAFYHQSREFLAALGEEARAKKSELLIGMPVMDIDTQQYFNALVSIGQREQIYSKQHLVPFGEYIPLSGILGGVLDILQVPLPDFSAQPSEPVLELAGRKMGVSICYEDAFGEEVIQALPDASVLINVSNDAWFGNSFAPHQHLEIARMRAVETARPMLRATNTGVTAVIDHYGRINAIAPQFAVAGLDAEVQPTQGITPYVRLGNYPIVSFLFGWLVVTLVIQKRRTRTR